MRKGLFRMVLPGFGECARTHLSAGDAAPFLERHAYEALSFEPPFDTLPTHEEYRNRSADRRLPLRNFESFWSASE